MSDKHQWIRDWLEFNQRGLDRLKAGLTLTGEKPLVGHHVKQRTISDLEHSMNQMRHVLKLLEESTGTQSQRAKRR